MTVIRYLRDQGPICYEAMLPGSQQMPGELPTQLLSTDLSWYWLSELSGPTPDSSHTENPPPTRPLTQLTSNNAAALLADFAGRNSDHYGRFIALFGIDSGVDLAPRDGERFQALLEAFSLREEGPIRIIIVQLGDSPAEHIFVPHDPIGPVQKLLESWGIRASAIGKTRPYKKLYTASLESLLARMQMLAHGKQ